MTYPNIERDHFVHREARRWPMFWLYVAVGLNVLNIILWTLAVLPRCHR